MDEVARTRSVYESNSDAFVEKYRRESIAERFGEPFFDALQGTRILDVGCGPGSDAETFADRGYDVTGLDVTPSFIESGRENVSDARFALGDMRTLPFGPNSFDGVWACASLLHVPRGDVPATLSEFARVLDGDGTLYCSLKRGDESGFDGLGRFFERHTAAAVCELLVDTGFEPVHVETADAAEVASQDGWVQAVARVA
ncbi:class I SAM-dependent methyltransferase [Haloarchaeobius iranensis]|uniref:Methyltransferase domain-containing protein n=1 Tax=Haloarchaeobius iranensis TaxID=996166 RepID=A0A1G9Y9U2_9EURY|nr:class I SAM-dependent methyltransferase [Haloarchaeobius iranensis]SDN05315.1 Methyltransferase domain-containing protein [Haloarchaeobius iranensis]